MNSTPADLAINRVLQAEQEARAAVAACREAAASRVAQAREQAREVADRADRRIGHVHGLADRSIERQCQALDDELRELEGDHEPDAGQQAHLRESVERLLDDWFSAGEA
jgi:hypothetical protein